MSNIKVPGKHLSLNQNVSFIVRDKFTNEVVSVHEGHNSATNSLLLGIAHYLVGDGVLNQGWHMLRQYVPKYISLGTMGLINQTSDENGLPAGIGVIDGDEETRFKDYMLQCPGYGADGYDINVNNNRPYLGLGPMFENRESDDVVNCELISNTSPRSVITFRDIVPETESEFPQTIDIVFSAMISVGQLSQFRESGNDYLYITEAGLWSKPNWVDGGDNGLLAGYRIAPTNRNNWGMTSDAISDEIATEYLQNQGVFVPSPEQITAIKPEIASNNRQKLKQQIIRVNKNQVVQVIWKIQLGGLDQLVNINKIYPDRDNAMYWEFWS